MAYSSTMPPDLWMQVGGLWVHVTALDDPLLYADLHRVTVHRDENTGHLWVEVAGNNAGVRWQTSPADTHDFARTDGEPL